MIQLSTEPVGKKLTNELVYWAFRADGIKFLGADTDREVSLTYLSLFPEINGVADNVFGSAKSYLTAKLSALVHLFTSQNQTLADACNGVAENELNILIRNFVKRQQAVPAQPTPFINTGWD